MYLDHASTSWPKAPGVAEAVARALVDEIGGPGRGGHAAARRGEAIRERARARLSERLALRDRLAIFTSGATSALNLALLGLCQPRGLGEGPARRVLVSPREHNAVTRPLAWLEARGWARVSTLPTDADGRVDPEASGDLAAGSATTPPADLCVCTAADNVTGLIQPVAPLAEALRARSLPTLLLSDVSQTAGVRPLPTDAPGGAGADIIAFGAHKGLRGPAGLGVLAVGRRAFDPGGDPEAQPLQPTSFGGTGGSGVGDESIAPAHAPARFEAGTPPTPLLAGLLAALDALCEPRETHAGLERTRGWLVRTIGATQHLPGLRWVGPAGRLAEHDDRSALAHTVGVASFAIEHDAWSPDTLAAALDASFDIRVRAGLHCAPAAHRTLGTLERGGLVRVSPGAETNEEDAERFAGALAAMLSA